MIGILNCPHCGKSIDCSAEDIEAFAADSEVEAECPYCQKTFQMEMPPMPSRPKEVVAPLSHVTPQPLTAYSKQSLLNDCGQHALKRKTRKRKWIIGILVGAVVYGLIFTMSCISERTPSEVKWVLREAAKQKKDGQIEFCGFYPGMSERQLKILAEHYGLSCSPMGNSDVTYGQYDKRLGEYHDSLDQISFKLVALQRLTKCGPSVQEIADAVATRIGPMANDVPWPGTRIRYDNANGQVALFLHNIQDTRNAGLTLFSERRYSSAP